MNPFRGIGLKIVSVMMFLAMSSLIKAASHDVPAGEAVFFRSAFAVPVILIWLRLRGDKFSVLKTSRPLDHFWRGLVGTIAMTLGFAGLGLLPLPEVTAIGYSAPLLTVIFAAMFLGERVRSFRLGTVALGLVGVLIILSPRLDTLSSGGGDTRETLGAVVVLAGAAFSALAQVFIRKLVATEKAVTIVFYFSVISAVLSLVTIPFGWAVPSTSAAIMLVLAGIAGGIGQIFLTNSYRFADASIIAPFEYSSIIFALLIGYFVFAEVPTTVMLTGASLIIVAGIIIIWREAYLGLDRSRLRKVMTPQG